MSDEKKFVPFVPTDNNMSEFTFRALFIGLVMSIILGAANAYLGLRAGITIAATYTAAVIRMAILKTMKGTMLEEKFARTVGSVGETLAAGAIFTLPALICPEPLIIVGLFMGVDFVMMQVKSPMMVSVCICAFPEISNMHELNQTFAQYMIFGEYAA